jgi:hypothetical protein
VRHGANTLGSGREDRVREGLDVLVKALAGEREWSSTVPAGTPHRWWNAGPGDALVSVEMRPGLHFEELLEEAFQLVDEGKFGENGPIDQAATDRWATKWQGEYRLA